MTSICCRTITSIWCRFDSFITFRRYRLCRHAECYGLCQQNSASTTLPLYVSCSKILLTTITIILTLCASIRHQIDVGSTHMMSIWCRFDTGAIMTTHLEWDVKRHVIDVVNQVSVKTTSYWHQACRSDVIDAHDVNMMSFWYEFKDNHYLSSVFSN